MELLLKKAWLLRADGDEAQLLRGRERRPPAGIAGVAQCAPAPPPLC